MSSQKLTLDLLGNDQYYLHQWQWIQSTNFTDWFIRTQYCHKSLTWAQSRQGSCDTAASINIISHSKQSQSLSDVISPPLLPLLAPMRKHPARNWRPLFCSGLPLPVRPLERHHCRQNPSESMSTDATVLGRVKGDKNNMYVMIIMKNECNGSVLCYWNYTSWHIAAL